MKRSLIIIVYLLPLAMSAQIISGKITNERNEPLAGASIYWIGDNAGVATGENGVFEIFANDNSDKRLIVRYVGHVADTIEVGDQTYLIIALVESESLDEVIVRGQRGGIIISDLNPVKTEQITQAELGKAACCDLAGCFETQATVQPQTTNVITNAKELRILGLSGVYNQVLIDGFPIIQGLSYTYGISSIPGSLVDNIYVSKGANSVLQGYESISGQINVETKEPDDTDQLFLNVYLNSFLEKHFNANYTFRHKRWSNLTAVHTIQPANRIDGDYDTFLDLPLLTRYMVFNKWKYGNEKDLGWSSRIGLRFLNEERIGGQAFFDPETDTGSTNAYGQTVNINQPEIWTKTGFRLNDRHNLVLFASAFYQEQRSFFGTVKYEAQQMNFYGNMQYELSYADHELKTGISYRHLNLDEDISFTDAALPRTYAGEYKKIENIPGFFAENLLRFLDDKLTWIAGVRIDDHNTFGWQFTPRTLVKYDITPGTIVRANFGTGWRTVNLFSENIGLLVSSRDIIFSEELQPEEAVNFGANLVKKFESKNENLSGYLSVDYYRTNFQNQIFPDYNTDAGKAIIKNFTGKSISNGFQVELNLKFWQRIEYKTGYNFLDVFHETEGKKEELPFNSKHKVMAALSYKPLSERFNFDMNLHWYGWQQLPDTKSNPVGYRRGDVSTPYSIVNAQLTYRFGMFEIYGGCENIINFRQHQAIIGWQDPFGPYFDTSSVWGPTRGREMYVGVRMRVNGGGDEE